MSGRAIDISRRGFVKLSMLAGASFLLTSCSGQDAGPADEEGSKSLAMGISNPSYIEPYNLVESSGLQVCSLLFLPLLKYDWSTGQVVCAAASEWSVSEDGLSYVFTLPSDVLFSNGEAVTSFTFKDAWERIARGASDADNPSKMAWMLSCVSGFDEYVYGGAEEISGISAYDGLRLDIELSYPYPDFEKLLCHPSLSPVPSVAFSDPELFARSPVGNGPYMMQEEWADSRYIRLMRNGFYHLADVPLDNIELKIFKDDETAYSEFQASNIDISYVPAASFTDDTKGMKTSQDGYTISAGVPLATGALNAVCMIVVNLSKTSVPDIALRQALSFGIDRQALCEEISGGLFLPADDLISPKLKSYRQGAWDICAFDAQKSADLLSGLGFSSQGTPASVELSIASDELEKAIGNFLVRELSKVGISIKLNEQSWSDFESSLDSGDFDFALYSWSADFPDTFSLIDPLFLSSSPFNLSYSRPELDDEILAARQITNDEERLAAYQAIDDRLCGLVPVIPLFAFSNRVVCDDVVSSLYCDACGLIHLDGIELS